MSLSDVSSMETQFDPGGAPSQELGRTPPQDITAEQSVLGGMLLSKDMIADVVEVLRGKDFYRPAHELVFEAVLDLYGRGEPADAVTVAAELNRRGELARVGGPSYLHTLISSVPTAANAGYYAEIVRERAVLRRLVEAGTRIVQMGYTAGGDVDKIVDGAQAEIFGVAEKRNSEDYHQLRDIIEPTIEEIEAAEGRGAGMVGIPTGFADLDQLTNGLHPGQMIVLAARPAVGKALALDTPLPTPTGWTTMGEVQVGDLVLTADGRPTRVVAATEVMTGRPCFDVLFDDGSRLLADAEHQWLTDTRASRRGVHAQAGVRTTEEIEATLRCQTADRRLNHSINNAKPLDLPEADLLVDPYLLGTWLGDGASATPRITTIDHEMVMRLEGLGFRLIPAGKYGYQVRLPLEVERPQRLCVVCGRTFQPKMMQVKTCGRSCGGKARAVSAKIPVLCPDCGLPYAGGVRCAACHAHHGTLTAFFRRLGVLNNKHIPVQYLRASVAQRKELLAGLLDTDGTVNPTGSVQFTTTSPRLRDDVAELLASLGYRFGLSARRVRGKTEASSIAWTLTFTTADEVFHLSRKQVAHKERSPKNAQRRHLRYIREVRPADSVPVRCIQVADPSHLYLAGRSMIPTHNSTMGLDIARAASIKAGLTSVIFSLEMSRTEITMRMLSAESKVSLQNMRKGTMREEDWTRLARTMGRINDAPLFIDDSPNMSLMEIRSKCRRLKQRHDLKLVVVDYLQLMSSGKRVESRQQEVSEFSRALKLLAKELEVPVIAISQLNRGPEQRTDKKPAMSDLRESGSIEQDADMVILLHREDAYDRESPRAGEADFIVAKHRNGPTDTIVVAFQGQYSRFVDMPHSGG